MFYLRIFPIFFLLTVFSFPSWAALELVDNFNAASIDFTKWSGFESTDEFSERFMRIDQDDENLVLINAGDGSGFQATRQRVLGANFSALQATISVVNVDNGGGKAAANLEGQYYNAVTNSASFNDVTGDVFAMVSIGNRGNGFEAWWEILVSTDPVFETWNVYGEGVIIGPGILNTMTDYVAKIEYNNDRTFTFTVDNGVPVSVVQDGPIRIGSHGIDRQSISASIRCCGTNPSIHATFDDIFVGNLPHDDFSTSEYIDKSKWWFNSEAVVLSSRVDPSVSGKLFMSVSDENIQQDEKRRARIFLKERNPDRIEAKVAISSDSVLDPGLRARARLYGYAYNEQRDGDINALPYDGCDGDVYVMVDINLKDSVLYASAFAGPETSDCDTDTTLISNTFTQLLSLDTEYLLWIERDGKKLTLGLDDERYVHNITTPIYSPSPDAGNGYRTLSARIQGTSTSNPAGADGVFEMLVDNVYVSGDGDGGGGCFIATAAYGSYLDQHVLTLREFRDHRLLTNSIGTWFVEFYYRHSPPIADYIRERESLRAMIRSGLALVIFSIEYPITAGLILLLPVLILIRQRMSRLNVD